VAFDEFHQLQLVALLGSLHNYLWLWLSEANTWINTRRAKDPTILRLRRRCLRSEQISSLLCWLPAEQTPSRGLDLRAIVAKESPISRLLLWLHASKQVRLCWLLLLSASKQTCTLCRGRLAWLTKATGLLSCTLCLVWLQRLKCVCRLGVGLCDSSKGCILLFQRQIARWCRITTCTAKQTRLLLLRSAEETCFVLTVVCCAQIAE